MEALGLGPVLGPGRARVARQAGRRPRRGSAHWRGSCRGRRRPLSRRDDRVPARSRWALPGCRRHRARRRHPRVRRHRRPHWMRQVNTAQRGGRAAGTFLRLDLGARRAAHGRQHRCRLSLPAGRRDAVEDGARQCRHRPGGCRGCTRASPRAGPGVARARRAARLRRPLPSPALGRAEEAGGPRPGADPRPQNPADGRAVRAAGRPDAPDHGQSAAGAVGPRPQGRAVRHPRSGGGDRAGRPRGDHVGGAGGTHHRRLRDRPGQAPRCLRGAPDPAFPRAAQGHLDAAQRRGDEGLQRGGGMSGGRAKLLVLQALVAVVAVGMWHVGSSVPIGGVYLLPKFFFSTPADVAARVWTLFADGTAKIAGCSEPIDFSRLLSTSNACFGKTVWQHLLITLTEGVLAFVIGAVAGVVLGFWLARNPLMSAIFDPYIKMLNALPRVVLAPIFMLWLGLGIWSKVALGVTLVFFIVFFNVYQGVKEVSPVILANARMLGMSERQLFAHVYWPSALSWMFSSLHTSVGFAIIGAVVGEYLGSAAGLGHLIQQAEGTFDTTGVFAGMVILAVFVLVIDWLVTLVERRLLVWRPPAATGQA